MNDRSRTRSIRRRKWPSATNDSKSMVVLTFGSNACTPCMADSLLENSGVPNATTPKTLSTAKNQAESELAKLLFFNRPGGLLTNATSRRVFETVFMRPGVDVNTHPQPPELASPASTARGRRHSHWHPFRCRRFDR